ncbi:helicase-related protein [Kribbella sp. NBC_00359]|uniref:helicase-related protein n=1 Tax=Kribbella sp. NBC_00359 TaxID=2975966 RepID=UPI003FA5964A
MDQLSRNEQLRAQLRESEWDLVIVDEAHRMGAHFFGGKLQKTKRFQLGELLGEITRHLLLMTATPHSGKEEDFQLFLTLLDRDRFEGKNKTTADTSGIMRPMIKEDLLTFEGRKLFPERIAETVPYELTALEYELYEQVTACVREGMNRADRVGGKRKNTVGFALTVLQRRLASSPEAIYRSLVRRSERLLRKKQGILDGTYTDDEPSVDLDNIDAGEFNAEEIEELEEELLDAATAAQTVAELDAELLELSDLTDVAKQVRDLGADRKWTELSTILRDHALTTDSNGWPRKFIIFTEHRDTLEYLRARISSLIGSPNAVKAIHGGVRRGDRRQITEDFTKNRDCQILIATDAAGEGLNLQAAPDGQLRPAMEPEPHRTALRPDPPYRPGGSLPPVEYRRSEHSRGGRSSTDCSKRSRSSERRTAARSSTSSVRRSQRPHYALCCWMPSSTANVLT